MFCWLWQYCGYIHCNNALIKCHTSICNDVKVSNTVMVQIKAAAYSLWCTKRSYFSQSWALPVLRKLSYNYEILHAALSSSFFSTSITPSQFYRNALNNAFKKSWRVLGASVNFWIFFGSSSLWPNFDQQPTPEHWSKSLQKSGLVMN